MQPPRKRRSKNLPPADPNRPLTQRQQRFIEILSQDPRSNQAAAAEKAGYQCKHGTTYKTIGWSLMNQAAYVNVQAAYKKLAEERWAKYTNVTDEKIYHLLTVLAFGDRRRIMTIENDQVKVTPPEELWPEEEWLIDSYKVLALNDGSGDTIAMPKLVDRATAVQMLCKARGMFIERVQVDASVTVEQARESLKGALAELAAPGIPGPLDQPEEPGGTQPA